MTTFSFIPIFEDEKYIQACREYEEIWAADGSRIISTLMELTGREFDEARVAAIVYSGPSFSGRNKHDTMKLREEYDYEVKRGTLVHELSHRLMFDIDNDSSGAEHKFLNLFLYDVWEKLYGKEFADKMVAVESARTDMYKTAWEYALAMSFEERQTKLRQTLNKLSEV